MNNLAALLLFGALGTTAVPARALEPVAQPSGGNAPITYTQNQTAPLSTPGVSPPPARSQSNVEADPATQVEPPGGPPAGALSLSQIISQIESRPDCAYIKDIDWEDGRYQVVYRTRDGRDRDLKIDPRTGRPQEGSLPLPQWFTKG